MTFYGINVLYNWKQLTFNVFLNTHKTSRPDMNIEDFREYCLSLPGAEEKMPFTRMESARSILVFSVAGKWFCFVDIDAFDFCNLKCDPTEAEELEGEYDGIRPGYHMNKRHWISVYFNSDVHDDKIIELVRKSYDLIVTSLPKRLRSELDLNNLQIQS